MATITRWPGPSPYQAEEGGWLRDSLFGRRNTRKRAWHLETPWLRTVVSTPEHGETVLQHDEVTLAKTSLTPGRVLIALSDEQAEQVKRIAEGH